MKLSWKRNGTNHLECHFDSGRLDGRVPLSHVFLRGSHLDRLTDQRLAFIGYLLVRDIVSHTIEFEGISVPPFLVAAFNCDFGGMELYVSPIEVTDRYIVHPHRPQKRQSFVTEKVETDIKVKLTDMSIELASSDHHQLNDKYKTNIPFFLSLSSKASHDTFCMIAAALAMDIANANIVVSAASRKKSMNLMSQTGFSFEE